MADPGERAWALAQSKRTRRELIMAGMRLMAEEGIDGVSLRAVNVAAGARNSSATHYHFGSKMGLVEAIVDTLAEDVTAVRRPLIDALRNRPDSNPPTPREIVEAGYLPFLGLFYQPEYGMPGIKFLSRLIVDTDPDMRVVVNRFTTPFAGEMFALLSAVLPDVPPRVLKARILFSLTNLINGSSDAFSLSYSPYGDMSYKNPLELAHHFLEYIVAGLSAPADAPAPEFVSQCEGLIETFRSSGSRQADAEDSQL